MCAPNDAGTPAQNSIAMLHLVLIPVSVVGVPMLMQSKSAPSTLNSPPLRKGSRMSVGSQLALEQALGNMMVLGKEQDVLIESLRTQLAEAEELNDTLRQEAQIHAQEARTANGTIYEIYQAITGATGEPGNWNGAKPVIEKLAQLQERAGELEGAIEKISESKDWDDSKLAAETMALNKRTERRHGTKLTAEECKYFSNQVEALTPRKPTPPETEERT